MRRSIRDRAKGVYDQAKREAGQAREEWKDSQAKKIYEQAKDAKKAVKARHTSTESGESIIPPYYEPAGDSGFFVTGHEPVDPTDCDRWSSSPWCDGGKSAFGNAVGLPAKRFADPDTGTVDIDNPLFGVGIDWATSNCEACVEVDTRLTVWSMPALGVCYRIPDSNCQPLEYLRESRLDDWVEDQQTWGEGFTGFPQVPCLYKFRIFAVHSSLPMQDGYSAWTPVNYYQSQLIRDRPNQISLISTADPGSRDWDGNDYRFSFYGIPVRWSMYIRSEQLPLYNVIDNYRYEVGSYTYSDYVLEVFFINGNGQEARLSFTQNRTREWNNQNPPSGAVNYTPFEEPLRQDGFFGTYYTYGLVMHPPPSLNGLTHAERGEFQRWLFRTYLDPRIPPSARPQGNLPVNNCDFLPPPIQPPMQPLPPIGEDDMCDCDEILELLRALHKRLGVNDYPIKVPDRINTFGGHTPKVTELESLTQFNEWIFKQFESLIGEFPVNVQIVDEDPTKEGNQTKDITFPNMSEMLAEMFALNFKGTTNTDIHTSFLMRLASELLSLKAISMNGASWAKASGQYLGFDVNHVAVEVPCAFNPLGITKLEDILDDAVLQAKTVQNVDPDTVEDYLRRLMFSAGIIKAVFYRSEGEVRRKLEEIEELFSEDGEIEKTRKDELLAFFNAVNAPDSSFNKNSTSKPWIKDVIFTEGVPSREPRE
jgi:hypothetical protein